MPVPVDMASTRWGTSRDARRRAAAGGAAPGWVSVGIAAAAALAVFVLAYDDGGYALAARGVLAIAVWWTLLLGVALALLPLERVPRGAIAGAALLAAFALFTLLSAAWAADRAGAVAELNRVSLYLALFLLGALASSRATARGWNDGLALGIAAVAFLAVVSRFFHGLFSEQGLPELLPTAGARLSFPVGYWNGLAILVALAVPLLLATATTAARPVARGLAVVPLPAVAATIYLASSRGGVATAVGGAAAFVVLARRWAVLGALTAGALGAAAAIAVLLQYDELVDGPLGTSAADAQGLNAAFLVGGICLAAGGLHAVLSALPPVRVPAAVGWGTAALLAAAALAAVAAADPVERFAEFREPPPETPLEREGFARGHLGSTAGSGRWQFWEASVEQWRTAPLRGRGAGSYEAWWAQHGTVATPLRDAHSLYVETLGELGLVGLALVLAALATPLVAGIVRLVRLRPGEGREHPAAFAAVAVAFLLALGLDWMWELTVVGAVGMLCLGLTAGPASRPPLRPDAADDAFADWGAEPRFGLGVALLAGAWFAIVLQALPLLADVQLRASQEAAREGDVRAAFEHARSARALEPWNAEAWLQLALLQESAGQLAPARDSLAEAIDRDPENWRLWLVSARLETKSGRIDAARRSLARAEELNPRSPLFR